VSFRRLAWFVVGLAFPVIAWGAVVRATGSGAGCGNTWPTCDGQLIPLSNNTEQLIELSHRLTSALFGFVVIALVVSARRNYSEGHRVRRLAWLTLFMTGVEGALGAGLVQFEQVADNAELSRAFWISGHLVNTLILLGVAYATAWFASNPEARFSKVPGLIVVGASLFMIVGVSGAITALGDTLFPAESFAEGLQAELSVTANLFERLRIAHPIIAVASALAVIGIVRVREDGATTSGRQLIYLLLAQLGVGVVNVLLAAPIWMQVVHLVVADAVWLLYVRYGLEVSVRRTETVSA